MFVFLLGTIHDFFKILKWNLKMWYHGFESLYQDIFKSALKCPISWLLTEKSKF
jgi:hypothetical protein